MNTSAAIVDSPLRHTCTRMPNVQASRLSAQSINVLLGTGSNRKSSDSLVMKAREGELQLVSTERLEPQAMQRSVGKCD